VNGVVRVRSGLLRGVFEGGTWSFRGIPYADDPSGSRRWRRPEPPASWAGTLDVVSWGPIAPQSPPVPGLSIPDDPRETSEACLSLNVWTPAIDDSQRPVLVWIHGGGFTSGTGASVIYRGDRLSSREDVVVVTLNYRIGALGFLAHPSLAGDDESGTGNWGLWDQVAALGWVRDNIAAFGGDPANVTVFGESAGAMSISALLASEACGRLFHKAVIQSGPPVTASAAWAAGRAERFAALAWESEGRDGTVTSRHFGREALTELSAAVLVQATEELAKDVPREEGILLPLLPVVDGGLIDRTPADAIADGAAAEVPILIGTTRDEAALFVLTDPTARALDLEGVVRRVSKVTGEPAARLLVDAYRDERFKRGEPVGALDILTAITGDYVFRIPSLVLAAAAHKHQGSTFVYMFTWESPFLGGVFGSSHGLEVPFVFGTVEEGSVAPFTGSGPDASMLSRAMQRAWASFARNADPSCDELGYWPSFDPLRRPTMVLGPHGGLQEDPRGGERIAWDDAGVELAGGHHHDV
jgi:para-nitrobenzyl esterase